MDLPFGLSGVAAAWLAFAVTAAAFVRGYSGFGFSAMVVAAAGLAANPVLLVPVVVIAEISMTFIQARGVAGKVEWKRVLTMLAGAALVMPISVALLARVGEDRARIAISIIILAMALSLLTGRTLRRAIGPLGHVGVGIASGLANGAAVGGLPVAAFMAAQPIAPAIFRATMIVYLTLIDIVALPLMWANGLVTRDTIVTALMVAPLLVAGIWLGGRRFLSATPQSFRRSAIILLIALSLLGLVKSVI